MAGASDSNALVLNEFVSLPIIITDYDAINEKRRRESGSAQSDQTSPTQTPVSPSNATQQRWPTGFSDFADDMWSRMTIGMKLKLREACVEVLKRTEKAKEDDSMAWEYDDDARFLD